MSLSAFLGGNVKKASEVEVVISDRFEVDGKPVAFKLAPITAKRDDLLREMSTKHTKKGMSFDSFGYLRKVTAETVVFPNLNDKELQDSYGAMSAEELLSEMLLSGEYSVLQQKVQEVNGFKSYEELEEEVKND